MITTTAAATQAGVTTATIRTWCRIGAVTATKTAGRWVIESASLTHRITIGTWRKSMTQQPTYRIEEATTVHFGKERAIYTIVRTDGTPAGYGPGKDRRIDGAEYFKRETAELYREFYERTPAGFFLSQDSHRAGSMSSGRYWLLTSTIEGDPSDLRRTWDVSKGVPSTWPEGTRVIDVLIHFANQHAEGAPARIAAFAEKQVIAEAEASVREAREAQLDELHRTKGALATPRQVGYILQLLADRERSGEGGGFFYGPTDQAGIEEMSRSDASLYITSLKGDY